MSHHRLLPTRSVFFACAGLNIVAGAYLLIKPLPIEEFTKKFAAKHGGDASKAQGDVVLLKGTELQLRGKGILLMGLGSALLCAVASSDKKLLHHMAAIIAAGDVALLALWAKERSADPEFPRVDAKSARVWVGLAAAEAAALVGYLASCTSLFRGRAA